jgi:hypothetical protein
MARRMCAALICCEQGVSQSGLFSGRLTRVQQVVLRGVAVIAPTVLGGAGSRQAL